VVRVAKTSASAPLSEDDAEQLAKRSFGSLGRGTVEAASPQSLVASRSACFDSP
jgi:hypothetical protein